MSDRTRVLVPGRVLGRWSWRRTNIALLVMLVLAFSSGIGAVATGSPRGGWVVVAHGVVGVGVVLLVPWKGQVVAGGLRRRRSSRWASLVLAGLTLGSLIAGLVSSAGSPRMAVGQGPLWVHIALALLLVPLLGWHVVARPVRPRRVDLGRRAVVRAVLLAGAAGGLYAALEGAVRVTGLAGAQRRFTGSHAVKGAAMPVTSWIDDAVPSVQRKDWRLTVADADGRRVLSWEDLAGLDTTTVQATLDCTSGWYAIRTWTGVPLARLIRGIEPGHRSVRVRSSTGYDRYLPLSDLDTLLLAFAVDGNPLPAGHGYPARLVAPGRRGFWWVKWVAGVELSRRPWWSQSPFPLT